MNIVKICSAIIVLMMLITGCVEKVQPEPEKIVDIQEKPARFSNLDIQGDIDVTIIKTNRKQYLDLIGPSHLVDHVKVRSENGSLHIHYLADSEAQHQQQRVQVILHTNRLHAFNYNGSGMVTAKSMDFPQLELKLHTDGRVTFSSAQGLAYLETSGSGDIDISNIKSRAFNLTAKGSNTINLTGVTNLRELDFAGDGQINLYWVDSPYLKAIGRSSGHVHLAGIAGMLDIQLHEHAQLDARYLRAQRAFIKTHDHAIADLYVINDQNVLAQDSSTVYFHNQPKFSGPYVAENGAILDYFPDTTLYVLAKSNFKP